MTLPGWIFRLTGTNIIVEIAETTEKPEIVPENEYCNIVATKDAKIKKITASNGTAMVKLDDEVTKGSILIGRIYGRKIYRN